MLCGGGVASVCGGVGVVCSLISDISSCFIS